MLIACQRPKMSPTQLSNVVPTDRLRSGGFAGRCACPERADSASWLGPACGGLDALWLAGPLALVRACRGRLRPFGLRWTLRPEGGSPAVRRPSQSDFASFRLAPAMARHLSSPDSLPHSADFAYSPACSRFFCGTCLPTVLSNEYVDTL